MPPPQTRPRARPSRAPHPCLLHLPPGRCFSVVAPVSCSLLQAPQRGRGEMGWGRGQTGRQGKVCSLLLAPSPPPSPTPAPNSSHSQAGTDDHGGERGHRPAAQTPLLPWPSILVRQVSGCSQQPTRTGEEMPRADRRDLKRLFTTLSVATPCPANRWEGAHSTAQAWGHSPSPLSASYQVLDTGSGTRMGSPPHPADPTPKPTIKPVPLTWAPLLT